MSIRRSCSPPKARPHPPNRRGGWRRWIAEESGFTLVEELVTVAVIGVGLIVLIAMVTTGVIGVNRVDRKVVGTNLARSQLELIKDAPYEPDPPTNPYPAVGTPPNYSVGIAVEYWIAPNGPFTPVVRNDGLQKLIVTVTYNGDLIEQVEDFKVDR